ncbi:Hypothetical predicted protein, partial [Pelobates cultripes]
ERPQLILDAGTQHITSRANDRGRARTTHRRAPDHPRPLHAAWHHRKAQPRDTRQMKPPDVSSPPARPPPRPAGVIPPHGGDPCHGGSSRVE